MLSQLHNVYNSCQVLTRKREGGGGGNTGTGTAVTSLGDFCMCLWLRLPCTLPEWSQSNHCQQRVPQAWLSTLLHSASARTRLASGYGVAQSNVTEWVSTSGPLSRCLWCTLEAGQWVCSEVTVGLCWHSCLREHYLYGAMKPLLKLSPNRSSNERESSFQKARGGKSWMLTSKDDLLSGEVSSLRTWQCTLQVPPLRACQFWVSFA